VITDFRDVVIEELAASEAMLLDYIATLEADRAVFRELAFAAFDGLRELTIRNEALQHTVIRLRDELHALRERELLRAGADDDVAA